MLRRGFVLARALARPSAARFAPARFATQPSAGLKGLSTQASAAFEDEWEDDDVWERAFVAATEQVRGDMSHDESVELLRQFVATGLLRYTDLEERPERFFKAHRLLARHAVAHGPGFWIRFTVHYNLCFGTVLAVGGAEQVKLLEPGGALERAGAIGCFALTERFAGVQSGLIVQTEARFDRATGEWVLHTPTHGAAKNWISQGFTADKAVVLAETYCGDGAKRGPHAFLMDLRVGGALVPGVSVGDMGRKTTGNDLDNAYIAFDRVRVPRGALLNRNADVDERGQYAVTSAVPPFAMIGQRLYSGRVAVAQAALEYRRSLFDVTRDYCDRKPVWHPTAAGDDAHVLSGVPQLRALFARADARVASVEAHARRCEERLARVLRERGVPDETLANAIATLKVKAVETAIEDCWRLKQEVGSFAFFAEAGFAHLDFLQACKFAEGDSRILMQKMARDRFRRFVKAREKGRESPPGQEDEEQLCMQLARELKPAGADKRAQQQAWDESWQTVYALAEATMARSMAEFAQD